MNILNPGKKLQLKNITGMLRVINTCLWNIHFSSLSLSLFIFFLHQFNDNEFQRLILYMYSIIMYSRVLENKGEA